MRQALASSHSVSSRGKAARPTRNNIIASYHPSLRFPPPIPLCGRNHLSIGTAWPAATADVIGFPGNFWARPSFLLYIAFPSVFLRDTSFRSRPARNYFFIASCSSPAVLSYIELPPALSSHPHSLSYPPTTSQHNNTIVSTS